MTDDDQKYRYTEVAAHIREQIASGQLRPKDQIPSTKQLKERFKVATGTVVNAVAMLTAEGLVTGRQGLGVYVTDPEQRRVSTPVSNEALIELIVRSEEEARRRFSKVDDKLETIIATLAELLNSASVGPQGGQQRRDSDEGNDQ